MMAESDPRSAQAEIEQLRAAIEAEKQLRYQAENRLRTVNADFREFTSMVCHDLREPLRTVGTYCELIAARKADPDGVDAKQFLAYILDGVDRMQSILSGMVEYAGAEVDKRHPVPIDMNAVFWEAARRIVPDPARTETIFTHDELPKIAADFDTITKVMRHLLDNGLKFNRGPDPRVHVSVRRDGNDWVFSVKDNGPGIDPTHHQRIFGLFKRLHGRDYPGNGLGLPFVRKALDGYGGRLWVESAPGAGSTFFFTLPALD